MIGHVPLRSSLHSHPITAVRPALAKWQRRALEAVVALLAFAVWGKLAYIGGFRLLARLEGVAVSGPWLLDALSLMVGVSGSIAGVSALWALGMQALGRLPSSLIGKPDDDPIDAAYRDAHVRAARRKAAVRVADPAAGQVGSGEAPGDRR